jgi:hypothetical protein
MNAPHDPPARPAPPTLASPGRRLFHLLIALAGWALFLYWWWLVLGRLDPAHVRFTVLFILATLAGCILLTAGWVFHNLRIFRRKGPRTHVRISSYQFTRDRVGRTLVFASPIERLATAPVIQIRLEHEGKAYRALESLGERSPSSTRVTAPVAAAGPEPRP